MIRWRMLYATVCDGVAGKKIAKFHDGARKLKRGIEALSTFSLLFLARSLQILIAVRHRGF